MNGTLASFFVRCAAGSFDRQLRVVELVGESAWQFDMTSAILTFGEQYRWHTQILGAESYGSSTWLWAWANDASEIPLELLGAAKMMRIFGQHHQIPELAEPEIPLGEINGHYLSMIASGVCRANAYFRAPYQDGAAFLLIQDESFPRSTEPPLYRIVSVFAQAISSLDIDDHNLAFVGYLEYHGLAFEAQGGRIVVRHDNEPALTATFDESSRLANLEAKLKPVQSG